MTMQQIGIKNLTFSLIFLGDRLLDIPCKVCGDRSSGKHYGIYSCDGKNFYLDISVFLISKKIPLFDFHHLN